jgi:hypothetical protein
VVFSGYRPPGRVVTGLVFDYTYTNTFGCTQHALTIITIQGVARQATRLTQCGAGSVVGLEHGSNPFGPHDFAGMSGPNVIAYLSSSMNPTTLGTLSAHTLFMLPPP